jgi:glutaredoxin
MRQVEVFIAGCPLCDDAVRTVREVACDSCEVTVYDLREGCATNECREKAERYGVKRVPTVVVDGRICNCCEGKGVNAADLRAAGIGQE